MIKTHFNDFGDPLGKTIPVNALPHSDLMAAHTRARRSEMLRAER
jgi:hypothetical protein